MSKRDDMDNYCFDDFTEENYRRLLNLAKKNYTFITYGERDHGGRSVLWRHDIDYSPHRGLALARIESEEGVRSTYFVRLNSTFYNVFELETKGTVKEIHSLGHPLGLHFDEMAYPIRAKEDLDQRLHFEKHILEVLFETKIEAFSFHNPTPSILAYDDPHYAGMVNTYSRSLRTNIGYCSDSNGYWIHERLEDFLTKNTCSKAQVLTHPEWWQKMSMSPRERIERCIEGRSRKTGLIYDRELEAAGRENIGRDRCRRGRRGEGPPSIRE